MFTQKHAETLSLFLTAPALITSGLVAYHFFTAAIAEATRRDRPDDYRLRDDYRFWMIVGVTVSFVSKFADNGYWAVPWSLSYVEHPDFLRWFNLGVYFNVVDRQLFGVTAAMCHLKSIYLMRAKKTGIKTNPMRWLLVWSTCVGLVYVYFLNSIRGAW